MLRSIKWMLLCASFLLSLSLNCSAEDAERRVALVIGNSAYQNVPALPNPRNDAQGLTASLRRMNFEVVQALDVPRGEMVGYMRQFRELLPGADVALLFYAGHGLAYEGQNYIVPTDASLEDEFDVKLNMHAIDLITDQMARSARINIVMLDACRDNPLARSLSRSLEGASRSASASRGLARIEQVGPQSVIMLATTDGETASDGIGAHSPFTQALLDNIETEGMELSELTRRVRKQVLGATRDRQRPVTFGSSVDAFYFVPAKGGAPAITERPSVADAANSHERDDLYWKSIRDLNSVSLFKDYLERFPNGDYAAIAKAKIDQLQEKAVAVVAPPPPLPSPQPIEAPPAEPPTSAKPACGWYAVYFCSQSSSEADRQARSYKGYVVDTSSRRYPNFAAGWYCVVEGPMARGPAAGLVEGAKGHFETPYFKKAC